MNTEEPDPLDEWIQHRRESTPELPEGFARRVMREILPPRLSEGPGAFAIWLGKAALLLGGIYLTGVIRTYGTLIILLSN